MDMDEIVDNYVREAIFYETDLWEIAHTAIDDLGASTPEEVLATSLEICRRLYERGVRPADYGGGRDYEFWPDEGCEAMLARIRREWIALGHTPVIVGEICSFIMPGTEEARQRGQRPAKD